MIGEQLKKCVGRARDLFRPLGDFLVSVCDKQISNDCRKLRRVGNYCKNFSGPKRPTPGPGACRMTLPGEAPAPLLG